MMKILWVARREFAATALTKGFILGVVMTPVLLLVVGGAIALMKDLQGPRIIGTVAVIDRSGIAAEHILKRFSPEALTEEAEKTGEETAKLVEEQTARLAPDNEQIHRAAGTAADAARRAATDAAKLGPQLTVELLPPDADPEKEKEPVATASIDTAETADASAAPSRLGLIVIPPETVRGAADGTYPPFQAFFADRLDFEVEDRITYRVAEAIVDARLGSDPRLQDAKLSADAVRALAKRPVAEAKTLSKGGEKDSIGEMAFLIPMAFMMLMMIAVFTSGQYLLTSTVEEKGNRVMEILLSAVSPVQLMAGKIVGQMMVGFVILVLYGGMGMGGLIALARADLIQPIQLVYLLVYFIIAYFLVASLMAAIGAAVNDMREAQTLMAPVMVIMMIPWLTWFLIQRAPNSLLPTVLSFIPGPNPFVMVIRLSGSEPVPTWQIPVSMLVGAASVVFAIWAAAKIFRVGALMYGKPPDFKTLVRWVRMA
jgi:ABC-2 type transport system permease protein